MNFYFTLKNIIIHFKYNPNAFHLLCKKCTLDTDILPDFFFFFLGGLKQGNYSFINCQMQTRKSTLMGTPKSSKEIGSVTYWKQIICAFSWILPHVFGYSKKYEQRSFLNYFLFNANAEEKPKYLISSFFTSTLNATFLSYHKTMI